MDINLEQMKELIAVLEDSTLTEISLEEEGYKITLKKNNSENSTTKITSREEVIRPPESSGKTENQKTEGEKSKTSKQEVDTREDGLVPVTSPIVGTFYRKPAPDSSSYVEMGDEVEANDTVCIVEAMKVMNEVKAGNEGRIEEILAEDGEPVEYGETLFLLKPKGTESEEK